MMKRNHLFYLLTFCILGAACVAPKEKSPETTDALYEQVLQDQQHGQALLGMKEAVLAAQNELKAIQDRLSEAKAARQSQTGVMIPEMNYQNLRSVLTTLEGKIAPLADGLEKTNLPFRGEHHWNDTSDADFGFPPLANEMVLEQLAEDIQATERMILEGYYQKMQQ